ncbi:MAG: branched-chain amino acid ABC transporter permease [Acidimicrobiia bacterium]|nr:branched-chain amino acid ABC transporter permease [Acidimicrobiia bacterium]
MTADLRRALSSVGTVEWVVLAILAGGLIAMPFVVSSYITALGMSIAMYAALASSWNMISGYAGYVSFGHVVFWGVGAYGCAIAVSNWGLPWPIGFLMGGLFSMLLALLVGQPILKLTGVYFAISTLAISEAVRVLVSVSGDLTGGGGGIYLPPLMDVKTSYLLMVGVAGAAVAATHSFDYTRFGRALVAIRENEVAAESLGIDALRHKITVFAISGFFAGLAGAGYVLNATFIDPGTAFDITVTLRSIIMAMIGGIGTVLGPPIGAIAFEIPSEWLWARLPFVHKAALGALIIAVVLLLPDGLVPAFRRLRARVTRSRGRGAERDQDEVKV